MGFKRLKVKNLEVNDKVELIEWSNGAYSEVQFRGNCLLHTYNAVVVNTLGRHAHLTLSRANELCSSLPGVDKMLPGTWGGYTKRFLDKVLKKHNLSLEAYRGQFCQAYFIYRPVHWLAIVQVKDGFFHLIDSTLPRPIAIPTHTLLSQLKSYYDCKFKIYAVPGLQVQGLDLDDLHQPATSSETLSRDSQLDNTVGSNGDLIATDFRALLEKFSKEKVVSALDTDLHAALGTDLYAIFKKMLNEESTESTE